MKLDKHVVDMFTELTKPADDVKMEKTCYGTISVVDGTRYVKLDGSDLLVPAASTVKTSHGDRVTVLMKNHSLTITGNLTAPATDGEGGSSGEAGTAATIEIGTVTTGEAGSSASVTNSGTTSAAVFDFVIPRGDKGEKGDTGPQGPQGEKGDTGTWDGTIPDHEHTVSDITDFPTSLPANGGNAETLDGKHASDFFNNIAAIITPESSGKETLAEYIRSINSSTSNFYASDFDDLPTNNWGYNVTVYKAGGAVYVIAYRALSNREIYVRDFTISAEWNGDWTRLNDGGNADTVDGKHASDLAYLTNVVGGLRRGWASTDIGTIMTYGDRPVTKTTNDLSYFGWTISADGWFVPIVVSQHSSGTNYEMFGYRFGYDVSSESDRTSFTYKDRIYYACWSNGGSYQNPAVVGGLHLALTDNDYISACKTLIDACEAIDSDTVDGLHASEIASNPNLLINPDFRINQRGISSPTVAFGVDRWIGTYTVSDNTIIFSQTEQFMIQLIENIDSLIGREAAAGVYYDDGAADKGTAAISDTTYFFATSRTHCLVYVGNEIKGLEIWAAAPCNIVGVKLELGSIATPFVPPDPATELAKCQRYYYSTYQGVPAGTPASYANELILNAISANRFNHTTIDFPATMRTTPTVKFFDPVTGEEGYACMSGSAEKVPVNVLIAGQNRAAIGSSGLTVGMDYYLHYTASAELSS